MVSSRYRVPGMDCAAEEQLVRLALDDVAGVRAVRVQLEDREVVVEHDAVAEHVDAALSRLGLGAELLAGATAPAGPTTDERPALRFALAVNAAFFVGEVGFGLLSRSMGLVADGLDMGADAVVYALSLAAVGTSAARKRRLARGSAHLELGLALLGLLEVLRRLLAAEAVPEPGTMALLSLLALAGNVAVLVVLRRVRTGEVHLEASWVFTANDVKVNLLVLAAAGGVGLTGSAVPDLLAGGVIFVVIANGARRIFALSR